MNKLLTNFLLASLVSISITTLGFAESATISVKGMVCESCSQAITEKLKKDPAVASVAVDVKKGLADVQFKDGAKIDDEALKTLIADAGYTATNITRKS